MQIPGTFVTTDVTQPTWAGRNILKAQGWFGNPTAGDLITNFQLVDVDNLLGFGANTVLSTWSEDAVPDGNKGLWIPPSDGHCIIIPPSHLEARVPCGMYIQILAQKATNVVDTFYANIEWDDFIT